MHSVRISLGRYSGRVRPTAEHVLVLPRSGGEHFPRVTFLYLTRVHKQWECGARPETELSVERKRAYSYIGVEVAC